MTEERQRQLSALVDGDLDVRRVANACGLIAVDPELRSTWERYHLIGQTLRGEPVDPGARGVADAVRAALVSEPLPERQRQGGGRRSSRLAPFAGAALAAGAAFLAVFAVPALFQGPDPGDLAPAPGRLAGLSTPLPFQERRWNLNPPDLQNKLDLFLVNHQEAAPATGVKGMLPYATLIGYEGAR
jgi:sigma-E factor negative regulatory protein RseA